MYRINLIKTITLLFLVMTFSVSAQHDPSVEVQTENSNHESDLKSEIKNEIRHHIKDSYEVVFFSL